jgi:hypothetical protein
MREAQAAALFAGRRNPTDSTGDEIEPGTAVPKADLSSNGEQTSNGRRKRKPR